ncbi:hypothetical protein C8A05DRAFT_48129 [Staphylotrichum tortipilum]|uniref:Uncharacterized protein n=1 Tax=Staphylotrichum tortipilum TaxID=2831512 RepID=A0AAN6MAF2_9PEZI|nr:hypothetical protein C8A05DRAFT_48129 [Staphylotrichum longicolle]
MSPVPAMENSSAVPAFPVPAFPVPAEHCVEPVVRDFSTIEEIIKYIVNTRQGLSTHDCNCVGESILGFHWQASEVDKLFEQLDARLAALNEPKVHRSEYDYESETVYLNIMGESTLHYQVQSGLRDYIMGRIAKLFATATDPTIRGFLASIKELGTADITYQSKIHKQADVSFGQGDNPPSLVCEVSKTRQYINSSDGKIQVVLLINLQYPGMKKAWVSLSAADDPSSSWVLFHDDDLDQQPAGQVALYLSDFVGLAPGIPAALCRPSTAEVAAGIIRNPTIALIYERLGAIFRRARRLHSPKEFTTEDGDEKENLYEEGREEGRKEERIKSERRVAEARHEALREARIEMAQQIAEMKRRMAAEIERRVAERRLDAE